MTKKLTESLIEQKAQTQADIPEITGLLGIPLGGQKLVEVPTRNAYVYVRLRSNQNEVIEAFNNQVAPAYNLPVKVARQGNRYTVLGVDTQRYENNWNSFAPFLPRHGNTHSFSTETGGGGDIVWIYPRQFMPSLIFPSGSLGAGDVFVAPYTLRYDDGTWKYTGNTGTQVLTTYNPATGTQAIMVLVYLDTVSGNPKILVGSGSYFANTLTGSSQVYQFIPRSTDPTTQIPLAAIRLITGTSAISWDNIYDVRQFLHTIPTGTSGGSVNPPVTGSIVIQDEGAIQGSATALNFVGSNVQASIAGGVARIFVTGSSGGSIDTGTLDARYLKLDASNDPLTGRLDITVKNSDYGLNVYVTGSNGAIYAVYDGEGIGAYIASNRVSVSVDQIGIGNSITDSLMGLSRYEKNLSYLGSKFVSPAITVADIQTGTAYYGGVLQHFRDSTIRLDINPNATGTSIPYIFDTSYSKPTGTILQSWRVQGSEKAYVDVSGTFYSNGSPLIKEAPNDGQTYGRKNAGWTTISNISSLPPGYLYGLTLSNSSGDLANDIVISTGSCRDLQNLSDMNLTSNLTKQLDASWAVGTNQGGLDTGTVTNATYHIWLIERSDTGIVDALYSVNPTLPVMPSNYDRRRRIGSIMRVTGSIRAFSQYDDEFLWLTQINDLNLEASSASAALKTLSLPSGIQVDARFSLRADYSSQPTAVLVTSPDTNDQAPTTQIQTVTVTASANNQTAAMTLRTNTSSQIRLRSSNTGATVILTTWGWYDRRGRHGQT